MPNIAGNSLQTATLLNLTPTTQSFPDIVAANANDYYRFSLDFRTSLSASITGIADDVNISLLNSAGNPVVIGGVPQSSTNFGLFTELINTVLDPGIYYIRVSPGSGVTSADYTLNIAARDNASPGLVWRNYATGQNTAWFLAPNGTVSGTANPPTVTDTNFQIQGTADFNRDGQSDLFWRNVATGENVIWYLRGNNQVIGVANVPTLTDRGYQVQAIADFNGDGSPDLFWRNERTGDNDIWYLRNNQVIGVATVAPVRDLNFQVQAAADFNGDGQIDLFWRNRANGDNIVWNLNNASVISIGNAPAVRDLNFQLQGATDINGDGTPDLFWRNFGNGDNTIWFLNRNLQVIQTTNPGRVADVNWRAELSFVQALEPTRFDNAGNTLATAFNIGSNVRGGGVYRERVGGTGDPNDYYRFSVSTATTAVLSLQELGDNLDLQLLSGTGDVLATSAEGSLTPESITQELTAGEYYIRVYPQTTASNGTYALALSLNSLPILATNLLLPVSEEATQVITNAFLQVTDQDNVPDELTYTLGGLPENGALSLNGAALTAGATFTQADIDEGLLRYSHDGTETLSDRFTFTVADGLGGFISLTTFNIAVTPVNDLPVLVSNQGLSLSEAGSVTITDTLLQFTDPDNALTELTYSVAQIPARGTLLLAGTATNRFTQEDIRLGQVQYQHDGSETVSDSFTFLISDGVIASPLGPTLVTITITPVNDPPGISLNAGLTLNEGSSSIVSSGALLITDNDGPLPITYTLGSTPTNGGLLRGTQTLTLGQTFSQTEITGGQIFYAHNGGETSSDEFTFTASDGLGAVVPLTTFSITVNPVNDPPVLTVPGVQQADQGFNAAIAGISVTDPDAGIQPISITLSADNGVLTLASTQGLTFIQGTGTADSSMSFEGDQDLVNQALRLLVYRSATNFQGADTISITVNDKGFTGGDPLSDSETITVNVAPVNDPPVITVPSAQTVREDITLPISGISIADPDAGTGELTVSLDVDNGILTLNQTSGLTFNPGAGSPGRTLGFRGTLAAINNALASLTYRGNANFSGSDSLRINVNDNGFTGNGTPQSDAETIAITITAVNDAPVITVPGTQSGRENTNLIINGISVTDVDLGNGTLSVALIASGSLSLSSVEGLNFAEGDGIQDSSMLFSGSLAAVNAALSGLTYRGITDFNGEDTIEISVNDNGFSGFGLARGDSQSIVVNVQSVNSPPSILLPAGDLETPSDTVLAISGLSVADPDAGAGIVSVSLLAANGLLRLTPAPGVEPPSLSSGSRLTFSGTISAVNATLATLEYRSFPSFNNGFDRITINVNDNGNSGDIGTPLSAEEILNISVGGAQNQAPIATDDTFNTLQGQPLGGSPNVLTNDSDPDNTLPLRAQLGSAPPNAANFTFNQDGTFSYRPRANFSGIDTFTYRVRDGLGALSGFATVTISVTAVNSPPVANNDTFSTPVNTSLSPIVGVLNNDTDSEDGTPGTATLVVGPTNAANFTLNPNGTFTYTPALNFSGVDRFTYIARDSQGANSNTATVTLSVTSGNRPPVAVDDLTGFSVSVGSSLSVPPRGVLTNDTDPDTGDTLTAVIAAQPTNGTVTLNPNGSFIYTPNPTFTGVDRFTYRANDGSAFSANTATVNITVGSGANQAPVPQNDLFTIVEDATTPLTGNVLADNGNGPDTDPDGNLPLTIQILSPPPAQAGTFTPDPSGNGTFTFTPAPNFNGSVAFIYLLQDSLGLTSPTPGTATISVTPVNDLPVAVDDLTGFSVTVGTSLSVPPLGVLANDTDVDGDTLTAVIATQPANGTLTLNPDGSFVYTPNATFLGGIDTFTYRANDGTALSANTATVNVTVVNPTNQAPVAQNDAFTVVRNPATPLTGDVLADNGNGADADPDNNIPLTAQLISQPANGTVTLNPSGTFTFSPTVGFSGETSFTYVVLDALAAVSNTATVNISVTAQNAPPVATNDSGYTVVAGRTLTVDSVDGVLRNDSDPDNDPLTASVVTAPASGGTLTLNANGSFVYTPGASLTDGVDTFTYQVSDGALTSTATVSITVSPNAAPVVSNDSYPVVAGGAFSVNALNGVLQNDSDPNGDSLTVSVVGTTGNGTLALNPDGSFTYTPNAGFTDGVDTFTYRASDGSLSSTATVTLSVSSNLPPIAADNTYNLAASVTTSISDVQGVLSNDSAPEAGQQLTASIVTAPTSAATFTLNPDGSFIYQPNVSLTTGVDSFVYRVSDGLAFATATVTLSIAPNVAPTADNDIYTVGVGTTLTVGTADGVLVGDTNPEDGQTLSAFVVGQPAQGTVTLAADGSFVYVPNAGFTSGTDTFTYRVSDGIAPSNTATVTLSISGNQPPQALPDSYSTSAGRPLTVTSPTVLDNDTDEQPDQLSAVAVSQTSNGTLSFNSDGTFVYVPNAGFEGTDRFTYVAVDSAGLSSGTATVTINVLPNQAPIGTSDTFTVNLNNVLSVSAPGVLGNDSDPEGATLTALTGTAPSQGTLTLNPNGSLIYTPNAGFTGAFDTFTYLASDGVRSSAPISVTVSVRTTSNPPVAGLDTYTIGANQVLTVGVDRDVLQNDSDPDGDLLTAIQVSNPSSGTVTNFSPDGTFIYTPVANFQGTTFFTYRATDGVASTTATVSITVGGPNSPPVVNSPGLQVGFQDADVVIPSGLTITDPDAGNATVAVTLTGTNGTLSLGSTAGITFTTGDGTTDPTMTFRGTLTSINTALQNLRFTPTAGFNGQGLISVSADDLGNLGSGGAQQGSGTVTVNISPGPSLVRDINTIPNAGGTNDSAPESLLGVGNTLYFVASDGTSGRELWRSDGTEAGTQRVADINVGSGSSEPRSLTVVGSTLYFVADNGVNGFELFRTNLTTGETSLVTDLRSGAASSNPSNLVNFNGQLFFRANDGSGFALWTTDGTPAGTQRVGTGFTQPNNLTVVGTTLYFSAGNGTELWRSNGTTAGTSLISSLGTDANISNLIAFGSRVYFTATDAINGSELWVSDGTSAGTQRVTNINPTGSSDPNNLVILGNTLYFFANTGTNYELWQVTSTGTASRVQVIQPSSELGPDLLTVVGSTLYFVVDSGIVGAQDRELWRSDGTTSGTVPLGADINLSGDDEISELTNVNGTLFFTANDGTGARLWQSNGTVAGTIPVSQGYAVPPSGLTTAGNALFFAAGTVNQGIELWRL